MAEISLCDEQVFSKLFNDYSTKLYNYIYYKYGNEALANDITQDAFLKLWQNCKDVIFATAKGYVFKTANNLMLNQIEKRKVRLKYQNRNHKMASVESPEFILEEKEIEIKLIEAINNLSEKQKVVFLMSRIDKMTYQEIADAIGISKKAVEKRIYMALVALRKVVKNIK